MSDYGDLLKRLIKFTDIKMSTVADSLGYDISYISKWCNKSKLPASRVSSTVNRSLAKIFSDEILNQKELESFCMEFSVIVKVEQLETYIYTMLKDAFKESESASISQNKKNTYTTRVLVNQGELTDFLTKELPNIMYTSTEPVDILCTMDIFSLVFNNVADTNGTPQLSSPVHIKVGIRTEDLTSKDYLSLYFFITKYHFISFDFYDNNSFGKQNLFVIKDKMAIVFPIDLHGKITMAIIINDPDKVRTIYERTQPLFKINHLLITATAAKEMMQAGYRSNFYAYGDFQMFMARGFEFLIPPKLIDSIVKSAYAQGFDESTERFLRKLIVTWEDIFSKEKVDFFLFKSSLLRYIEDGEIYFTDILHRMSVSEREQHIQHVLEMCKVNKNINFYIIDEDNIPFSQHVFSFALFNNHKKLFLKNTNRFYTDFGPQFYSIMNASLINGITKSIDSIKTVDACTHYPAESLQDFMDRYGGMVYRMLSLNELNDLCK